MNRKMQIAIKWVEDIEGIRGWVDIERIVRIQAHHPRLKLIPESLTKVGVIDRPGKIIRKMKKGIPLRNKLGDKIKLPIFEGTNSLASWKD